jgi:UbiD family decarboxylase
MWRPGLDGNPKAVFFTAAGPEGAALVGNLAASRSRLALAFGTSPERVVSEALSRLKRPQPVIEVERSAAPVQQVVQVGEEADLTSLPVHLQHGLDGAPYISASLDFVRDPSTGLVNSGMRRLMLRGRREAGIDLVAPSDLRAIYEASARRKEPLPVAFAVGSTPIDHLASVFRLPGDDLELMAALRGAPLPVVKCVTSDLRVPADAEYILEGYLDPAGHVEPEGPYGEFLGYYGGVKPNPLFHLTAITRRKNAIFQTSTIGGRSMHLTDTALLIALRTEITMWKVLENAVREPVAVHATPSSGGSFNVRIALRQRVPGEARNAIAAAFSSFLNVKHVFVVDPDIDVSSDAQMDWALATRFQADRALVVQGGMRTLSLDPSLQGATVGAKAGFDCTLPLEPGELDRVPRSRSRPATRGSASPRSRPPSNTDPRRCAAHGGGGQQGRARDRPRAREIRTRGLLGASRTALVAERAELNRHEREPRTGPDTEESR